MITEQELIELTRQLLKAITHSDWPTYSRLCATDLTSFEPEACGHLVQGMSFHQHYFNLGKESPYASATTTISSPHVRIMGDVAVIAYVRLTQRVDGQGNSVSTATSETRVWQCIDGQWKHVHFHRS